MGAYQKGSAAKGRKLRESMTDAERKLWSRVRNRQLMDLKFVRQRPVGPYVADFACRDRDLIIEVDGGQHADSARDQRRTEALAAFGYRVLRFWNNDVLNNVDGVLQVIVDTLAAAPAPGSRFVTLEPITEGPLTLALSPEGRGDDGRTAIASFTSPYGGEVGPQDWVRGPSPVDEDSATRDAP